MSAAYAGSDLMSASGYTFIAARWSHDATTIRAVREAVLLAEMGLAPEQLDMADERGAFHILVYDGAGRPVGAARMQPDGRIDYVVVLRPWRGYTVGSALLAYLHHIAHARKIGHIWVIAPPTARRFFEKNRFVASPDGAPEIDSHMQKYTRTVSKPGRPLPAMH